MTDAIAAAKRIVEEFIPCECENEHGEGPVMLVARALLVAETEMERTRAIMAEDGARSNAQLDAFQNIALTAAERAIKAEAELERVNGYGLRSDMELKLAMEANTEMRAALRDAQVVLYNKMQLYADERISKREDAPTVQEVYRACQAALTRAGA